jgi:prevent-host-death family protein
MSSIPSSSSASAAGSTVGIRALRQEAATFVRRAADGHRTIVTVNGQPAALLGPIATPAAGSLDDLVAVHALVPPRRRGRLVFSEPITVFSGSRLDRLLNEIR